MRIHLAFTLARWRERKKKILFEVASQDLISKEMQRTMRYTKKLRSELRYAKLRAILELVSQG